MGHCNFQCIQCHQLHHITTDHVTYEGQGPKSLSLERALSLLNEAAEMRIETIEICGRGEPTLFPGLDLLIRRTKELGFRGSLITNGSHLSKSIVVAIAESHFDTLTISLYGANEESFAKIARPRGGITLQTLIENIRHVKAVAPKTKVTVAFLLQEESLSGLEEMFALMRSLEVNSYKFIVSLPYRNRAIGSHAAAADNYVFAAELKQRCRGFRPNAIPREFSEFVDYLLANPQTDTIKTTYSRIPCYAGQWAMFVCDDGTVRPCSNSNWILGNIYESSLDEVWRGETYETFREAAASHIIKTGTPLFRSYCGHCGWARTQTLIDEAINQPNYKEDVLLDGIY